MGSKRKSAPKIYSTINNLSDSGVIYDVFCGGYAISEYFLKNKWEVHSSDLNKYVVALINQTIEGLPKKVFDFVSREKFFDVTKNPEKYEDWYIGFVQCIYSFGNNQKGYAFGSENEKYKYAGHQIVINRNEDPIKKLVPQMPQKYIDGIKKQETWQKRRMALVKVASKMKKRELQLQRLQQLEQLEQLERLEANKVVCKSYDQIEIPKGAVIYCDPPYQGTEEYAEGGFNHAKFWEWCREKSKTNKVFVSEYKAPSDFESVLSFDQKSTLQGGCQSHNNQPSEKLFVYNG